MGQQPFSVFDDQARRLQKIECLLCARPVADKQRKPCLPGSQFPFAIRSMNSGPPRSRRNEHSCALRLQSFREISGIHVATNEEADLDPVTLDWSDVLTGARPGKGIADHMDLAMAAED